MPGSTTKLKYGIKVYGKLVAMKVPRPAVVWREDYYVYKKAYGVGLYTAIVRLPCNMRVAGVHESNLVTVGMAKTK